MGSSLHTVFGSAGLLCGGPHMGAEGLSSPALLVRTVTCARALLLSVNGVCIQTWPLSHVLMLQS
jgi:hypothetical protein